MKNIVLFLTVITVICLAGCEKNDNDNNPVDPNNGGGNTAPLNPGNFSPPDLFEYVIPAPYSLVRWVKLSWDCYDREGDELAYTLITFRSQSVGEEYALVVKDTLMTNSSSNYFYYHAFSGTTYWQVHVSDGEYVSKGPILHFRLTR